MSDKREHEEEDVVFGDTEPDDAVDAEDDEFRGDVGDE